MRFFSRFWHDVLRRPYKLHRYTDQGQGKVVVLLHGLGRTGQTWRHLVRLFDLHEYRVVAFDLLGFGKSPKPEVAYTVDDHARAVIASIEKLHAGKPIVLAGHSMGCLIAVRVARLRPKLVKRLILFEMPLYAGLPDKRRYRLRLNFYRGLYKRVIAYQPVFEPNAARPAQRWAGKIMGFTVSAETWPAFVKSLENTILNQTTTEDIKKLVMPTEVIYGSRDRIVIRGKTKELFGEDVAHVTDFTIRANHSISEKSSQFLAGRIKQAFEAQP